MVWFCFCFAAASPPLVGLLSAFSHPFMECSILSHFLASSIFSFPVASLPPQGLSFPWVMWGTIGLDMCSHLTPGSSYELFPVVNSLKCFPYWYLNILILAHVSLAPDMVSGRGRRDVACSHYLGPSLFPVMPSKSLQIGSIHVCVSLSLFLFFFPFLLRYVKYSQ